MSGGGACVAGAGAAMGLMVFAAGLGTRMAPLTRTTPKALIRVGGRTLLDRALDLGRAAGADPVVVNIHHLGGQIRDHLSGRAGIAISDETGRLLDTGGGLRKAGPLLGGAAGGAVMTINPDVVWTGPNPLAALRTAWEAGAGEGADALLMLVAPGRAHGRQGGGDFALDAQGRLGRGGPLIYGGAQLIRPDLLARVPDEVFSLNRLWDLLIAEGRARGIVHPGEWCDVGRPDCIPLAEALL